jgi:hypothetical protein
LFSGGLHIPPKDTVMESKAECEICEIVLPTKNEYYVHANESHPNNVAKYWYECGHCKVRVLFNFVCGGLESGKLMVFNIRWCV